MSCFTSTSNPSSAKKGVLFIIESIRLSLFFLITFLSFSFAHAQTTVTINNGTTSWTVPAGATSISVQAWGGGGGGGGSNSNNNRGSGGGSGAYCAKSNITVTPGQVITLAVGAGGTAGASGGGAGGAGGATTILGMTAGGGNGGGGNNGTPGAGGTATGGTTNTNGTAGGQGNTANGNGAGSPNGGAGGAGSTDNAGSNGLAPGGGGGGAEKWYVTGPFGIVLFNTNYTGGAGGAGRIVITYYCSSVVGFGSNTWNVLGYNHGGYNFANLGTLVGQSYMGYYTDATVDINSQSYWGTNASPSSATGWNGCTVNTDLHTVVYKRQGFPSAYYQIDLNGSDDGVQCYVNGTLVYQIDGCCQDRGVIWSGVLCSTSTVEFRVMEGTGGSNLSVDFIESNWNVNAGPDASVCSGSPITLPAVSNTSGNLSFGAAPNAGISDYSTASSSITISGSTLNANQITGVLVNLTHSYDADIVLTLTAPNGSSIDLSSDNGGAGDNFLNTFFTPSGSPVVSGAAPFTGNYSPEVAFSNLTGSANGTWTLSVYDNGLGDGGTFMNWGITLSVVNVGSSYAWSSSPAGFTSTSLSPSVSPTVSTTYTLTATANGCTASDAVLITTTNPVGDPTVFGTNTWNVYVYNGKNRDNLSAISYYGYYTQSGVSGTNYGVNTQALWNLNGAPSSAAGYQGCTVGVDNHTFVQKRRGFPCGVYQLTMQNWDDETIVYINGVSVWNSPSWDGGCNPCNNNVGVYYLDANSTIEIRTAEGTGGSNCAMDIISTGSALNGGTIAGIVDGSTVCANADPGAFTNAASPSGSTIGITNGSPAAATYLWEVSTTSSSAGFSTIAGQAGLTYDPTSLSTTSWFRRKTTDACGNVAYSNVIQVNATVVTVSASASATTICLGTSTTLTASGATAYSWSNGAGNGSSVTVSPTTSTTYTVTGTDVNGCTNTATTMITVGTLSTATTITNGDFVWVGCVSSVWTNPSNWMTFDGTSYAIASTLPTSANNVIIRSNNTCVLNQPASISGVFGEANNVTIESGASMGIQASESLKVHGNWNNSGTLNAATGSIEFVGATGNQTITKVGGETIPYMVVNKANGNVVLANNVTVSGGLTLTSGLVEVGANTLALGSATVSGGSSASYVKTASTGVVKRNVGNSGAVFFPVGNSAYNPAELTNTLGSDIFSVRVVDAVYVSGYSGALQSSEVVNRTWMIEEATQNGNSVTMKLYWNGLSEEATSFNSGTAFVAHYVSASSMWDNLGFVYGSGYVASTQPVSSFSPFTISSSPVFAPLPVELLSLDAQCANENVIVSWKTASEHNTLNFIVERSENGSMWNEIQTVEAAGNSNSIREYAIEDAGAARGLNYYRLIQIDQDGVEKIYGPVMSNCGSEDNIFMSFPNPSDDEITLVFNNKEYVGQSTLTVRDANGRVVRSVALDIQPGTSSLLIPDMELTPGVYYLQLEGMNFKTPIIKHSLR